MDKLAKLIEETSDVRELKRALSVELGEEGMATEAIGAVLQVTPRAVRKWRQRCEREGVEGLAVRNRGSESYLSVAQRQEREDWLGAQETITVEEGTGGARSALGDRLSIQTILLRVTRREWTELPPDGERQSETERGASVGAAHAEDEACHTRHSSSSLADHGNY